MIGGLISGAASLLGGGISAITGKLSGDREYARQKEFAQNGIRWKVADAKAAGIHPIFAIGANTPTYSPQAAVGTDYGLSAAGQNISRAIEAGQTKKERAEYDDLQKALVRAQIDNVNAQTEATRQQSQLRGEKAVDDALRFAALSSNAVRVQQRTKSFPTSSNKEGLVDVQADTPVSTGVNDPTHTAASHPAFSYSNIGDNVLAGWEQQVGETLSEDIHMGAAAKMNYLIGVITGAIKGPHASQLTPLQKQREYQGWTWTFNPVLWSWHQNPPKTSSFGIKPKISSGGSGI